MGNLYRNRIGSWRLSRIRPGSDSPISSTRAARGRCGSGVTTCTDWGRTSAEADDTATVEEVAHKEPSPTAKAEEKPAEKPAEKAAEAPKGADDADSIDLSEFDL